jgi:hypothetical protein
VSAGTIIALALLLIVIALLVVLTTRVGRLLACFHLLVRRAGESATETAAAAERSTESIHVAEDDRQRLQSTADSILAQLTPEPVTTGFPVTVHTKRPDDQSIHGLLVGETLDRLELADAHFVGDPEKKVIPGVVRVLKANISFRQDHAAAGDASDS